jgi:alpha-D-xyloside xylohydrolase
MGLKRFEKNASKDCIMTNFKAILVVLALADWGMTTALADAPPSRPPTSGIQPVKVAPGIWRIRYGEPEAFTPTQYRSGAIRTNALEAMSAPGNQAGTLPRQMGFETNICFQTNTRGCVVEIPMTKDEQIYGFGLNTKLFNMADRRAWIRASDAPESELNDSHAGVPFYVSTAGYGVFIDSARYVSFYVGNTAPLAGEVRSAETTAMASNTTDLYRQRSLSAKTMVVDIPAAHGVDVYLFEGPTVLEAIQRYNLFSGGGCLPPMWGLGVWYRGKGDFNAADCLKLGKEFRDSHMPCDVWGLEPGWQTQAYSCSFLWNEGRFPDPEGFIRQMRGLQYHLNAWEHIFTHPKSPIYDSLKPYSGNFQVWNGLVPDFTIPQARQIFAEQQDKSLFSKGVESVKIDECDNQPDSATPWSFPECSTFPSGMDGELMHNLIGPLYQQVMALTPEKHNRRTFNSVRASGALAAPLPFVIYSDSYDHRNYVRGIAKSGFSGLLWTPELRDAGSVEELYRRAETLVFSAQTLVNCWYMKNPPWFQINKDKSNNDEAMAERDPVTQDIRKLFELRMSLLPYFYAAFAQYHNQGIPPFRAVVADYPEDPNTWKLDDEYLAGPSLLVAPLFAGEKSRSVYLPKGTWHDFWTGETIEGGRKIEVSKPLGQIPVYVKDNTLLPMARPMEFVLPESRFEITVRVYGTAPAAFTLFEDDGVSFDFERGAQNQITLSWSGDKGGQTAKTGKYEGPARYTITEWKKQ